MALSTALLLGCELTTVNEPPTTEDDGTASSSSATTGAGASVGAGSPAEQCDCSACSDSGGTCTDQCYDAGGCHSIKCYHPTPPNTDEFSCHGLLNCPMGSVCFNMQPNGDGCASHQCVAPPSGCVDDLTCDCLELASRFPIECDEDAGGPTVIAGGFPAW